MVDPMRSPTTLSVAAALPGTTSAGSAAGSTTAPEDPFTTAFWVTLTGNPSADTKMTRCTASEAEPSAVAAAKVRARGPRAEGVTVNCADAVPPPAGRETWTEEGPAIAKAPVALGARVTVAVVAAATVE